MDSNFQFRDTSPPPTAWAPSFGGVWRLFKPPQRLYRFAEADDCSDDTRADGQSAPTRTKPPNRCRSRAELKVRIHSAPAASPMRTRPTAAAAEARLGDATVQGRATSVQACQCPPKRSSARPLIRLERT